MSETITAIATANGVGAISIIRVSGDLSLNIAKKLTRNNNFEVRKATLRNLYSKDNNLIDRGIVIYFKAPYSFTGEDIVEFQIHGGVAITQIIIKEILKYGVRYANAGEFSKRAFLNGKIDLSQAEAISKLIEAKSEDSIKYLARQLKGDLKLFVEKIKDSLISILAYSEVTIDYAEDNLDKTIFENIKTQLNNINKELKETLDISRRREGELNGYRLSIIGKPNVGKSSLLNKMLNFNRAIVSDIEGTTRDTIEENIKIGTHLVKITDTAGIRDAKDSIEKIGIERTISTIDNSDTILALFDVSQNLDKNDLKILEILKNIQDNSNTNNKRVLILLNKIDLVEEIDSNFIKQFDNFYTIKISCKTDIKKLLDKLENILNIDDNDGDITLISTRQIDAVQKTIKAITNSLPLLENEDLEIFSFEINEALKEISTITKPYQYSDMLDKMFGSFCLGK